MPKAQAVAAVVARLPQQSEAVVPVVKVGGEKLPRVMQQRQTQQPSGQQQGQSPSGTQQQRQGQDQRQGEQPSGQWQQGQDQQRQTQQPSGQQPSGQQQGPQPSGTQQQQQGQTQQGGTQQGSPNLSTEQRTQIRTTVLQGSNVPRVNNVNFNVSVGTVVPRTVTVVEVPDVLIRVNPRWRGHRYFVYEEQIVIVEADSLRIVEVIRL